MTTKNHHISIKSAKMKKGFLGLFILTLLFTIFSCEDREKDNKEMAIRIETNKLTYSTSESILISVENASDSLAFYYKCSSYDGIPYSILKLEDNNWNFYWSSICDGYRSYCCPSLMSGTINRDTLNMALETGTYKLEYSFIVRPSHDYSSYKSNTFKIE
jgi:hypothetical protein